MAEKGSVTGWLDGVRAGDPVAAQKLWERYYQQLVVRAKARLAREPRTRNDAEDVVLSAFEGFFRAVKKGRFPQLNDRHDLWRLMMSIVTRKSIDAIRHARAGKRPPPAVGGRRRSGESSAADEFDRVIGKVPTPSHVAEVAEQFARLLARLDDANLRGIALLKFEGFTNEEIAALRAVSVATVERKLALIRRTLQEPDRHG